ncbi:uncharacterized protein LOC124656634 [Lolium rigidum]|uniref:uncharacterized protein LOC124656634 n=1 Tax=Lolium rigidum TaxID=89674 RepID=UPI001F5C9860|nr:uncharacterized protein LOC124656634 [Lolium rigidum]
MEMERMLGCQIPAFGVWNYCSDLPITQYFDLAMQARLLKRAQIKVIRREVEKQSDTDGAELLREEGDGGNGKGARVSDSAVKRMVAVGPVDEDLYKVPRPLIYQKPRKMRKVVWSLWIGCLGLDCIA